jgi:FixJ family two-component response regulator
MTDNPAVYIVDDDASVRALIAATVRAAGIEPVTFESADQFAAFTLPDRPACILLDLEMPGRSGLDLLERHFNGGGMPCPVIIVTAHASVQAAVKSMKLGAVDFLEKPFERQTLLTLVQGAIEKDRQRRAAAGAVSEITRRLGTLSPRERELLGAVIDGKSTKMIADELGISARTVDHHRANLMEKMAAANVADLVRMAVAANFKTPRTGTP